MDTKALRQKILDLAIHGKLVPQDPNDEPASVLLERIRAEKERLIKEGKIKKGKKAAKTSDKPHYPFELPKGWEWTTVGETCETHLGKMLDKLKNEGCYMSYLRNINVRWGSFDLTDVLKMRFKDDEVERYMIEKGDLVLCEGGEPGRCAIWDKANPIMFQKALHRIRCHGGVLNEYLKYVIEDYAKANKLEEYYTGSTIKHLTGESLVSILFPLPPIKEQERIVQEIQRYLSLVAIIENNKEKLLAAIKQAKSKVLELAIHGKLVPQDPNDEPARELLKRINPKAEITCDTPQYGKLPFVIPSSWEWVKLSGIAKSNIGLTYRPTDIVSTGVPVYRSNNIRNGKIDTTDLVKVSTKILEKQLLHVGDLLICARNGSRNLIGKNAIISELKEPTSFGAFMAVCRSAYNQWIRIVLNSEYFDRYLDDSNSATINQVTQKMLLALPIPLPPHQEQHRIVAKIEELFAQLDKIEASL